MIITYGNYSLRSVSRMVFQMPLLRRMSVANNESLKDQGREQLNTKQMLLKLRQKTGYPIVKCKQALTANNYDFSSALEYIKAAALKEGWERMETNRGRVASQGLVSAFRHENYATVIEVNCETDFVAKTTEFQSLVGMVSRTVLHHFEDQNSSKVEFSAAEMLKMDVPNKKKQIEDVLASTIGKLKENIQISRGLVINVDAKNNEVIGIYTHPDMGTPRKGGSLPLMGKYAALVSVRSTADEKQGPLWLQGKCRDLAQHVVGMNPKAIGTPLDSNPEKGDSKTVTNAEEPLDLSFGEDGEEDIYSRESQTQVKDSDELLKQPFLLDANITVQNWLEINQLKVLDFVRYEVGEMQNQDNSD